MEAPKVTPNSNATHVSTTDLGFRVWGLGLGFRVRGT